MSSGATPARSSAALMAKPPNSMAVNPLSAPDSFPIGVRAPATMTDPGMSGDLLSNRRQATNRESPVYAGVVHRSYSPVAWPGDRYARLSPGHSVRGVGGRAGRSAAAGELPGRRR